MPYIRQIEKQTKKYYPTKKFNNLFIKGGSKL